MKRDLLYQLYPEVSHELKSSLANIQAHASLIKQKVSPSEKVKILSHLEKIERDIVEMNTTLIDIADIIELAKKKNTLVYSVISLSDIITELTASWKRKRVRIHSDKLASLEIVGDRQLLTRAFNYLIKYLLHNSLETNPIIRINHTIKKRTLRMRIQTEPQKQKYNLYNNIVEELVMREIIIKHGGKIRNNTSFSILSFPLPEIH